MMCVRVMLLELARSIYDGNNNKKDKD